jgi:hypothetical protein
VSDLIIDANGDLVPTTLREAYAREHDAMMLELRRLEALPRDDCGCDRHHLDKVRQRWVCSGRCVTHGVRRGDRVAIAVKAPPGTGIGDQVALAQTDEKAIGIAQHDAMPGHLVDVVTYDREPDVTAERFCVADRPRELAEQACPECDRPQLSDDNDARYERACLTCNPGAACSMCGSLADNCAGQCTAGFDEP